MRTVWMKFGWKYMRETFVFSCRSLPNTKHWMLILKRQQRQNAFIYGLLVHAHSCSAFHRFSSFIGFSLYYAKTVVLVCYDNSHYHTHSLRTVFLLLVVLILGRQILLMIYHNQRRALIAVYVRIESFICFDGADCDLQSHYSIKHKFWHFIQPYDTFNVWIMLYSYTYGLFELTTQSSTL